MFLVTNYHFCACGDKDVGTVKTFSLAEKTVPSLSLPRLRSRTQAKHHSVHLCFRMLLNTPPYNNSS